MAAETVVSGEHMTLTGEPIRAGERVQVVDVLRGFALLGILLVNMQFFNTPLYLLITEVHELAPVDRVAAWLIRFFAEGKFYTMFSFLFGFGFAIQLFRAKARGVRFVPLYLRRLFVLLLIGIVHGFLLWYGDILKAYAVVGLVLLLFRDRAPKTLLIWAALSLAVFLLISAAFIGLSSLGSGLQPAGRTDQATVPAGTFFDDLTERSFRAYGKGTFGEIMVQRAIDNAFSIFSAIFSFPSILAMFLLGLYAGRRQIFQNVEAHLPFIRKIFVWGLVLGLIGNAMYVFGQAAVDPAAPSLLSLAAQVGQVIGGPALCFCYVAGITLLFQREHWQRRLASLAAVGRMALTNYLLQSVICTTIFYSYGLGLYGQVGPAAGIALTFVIYAAQIPLSVCWLRRFRFGPVEWLWRSLTYWRWQPLRA